MVKVMLLYTPDEFRKLLHEPFDKLYDDLVERLQETGGLDEKEAKKFCAHYFLEFLKKEQLKKEG